MTLHDQHDLDALHEAATIDRGLGESALDRGGHMYLLTQAENDEYSALRNAYASGELKLVSRSEYDALLLGRTQDALRQEK
jgi:hypothetical protein